MVTNRSDLEHAVSPNILPYFLSLSMPSVFLLQALKVCSDDEYRIYSIYQHPKTKEIFNQTVAVWRDGGFEQFNELSDIRNRSDLMGLEMTITTVFIYNDSVNDLEHMKIRSKDAISKQNYLLTLHVIEMFNITPKHRIQPLWGTVDPKTNIYNGQLGDLQANISEFGGTPSFITSGRVPLFDYIAATTPTLALIMFRAPPLSAVSNVFYLPFDLWVWYACVAILVVIYAVVYAIAKWEWSKDGLKEHHESQAPSILKPRFLDVVQMEVGGVCQQGSEAEPKSSSGRIATFVIFLSLMFLYTAFSASIVALLQTRTNSMKTLEDILYSKIDVGAQDISYNRIFLPLLTGKTQKAIVEQKIKPPNKQENFFSTRVGMEKLRTEFFGFFAECDAMYKVIADHYLEEEKCGLVEVGLWTMAHPMIPVRKGSQYKELIKVGYAKMNDRGIRSRNYNKIYAKKPRCSNQGASFTSVSINDCYFALVAFSIGVVVSVGILVLEKLVKRFDPVGKLRELNIG